MKFTAKKFISLVFATGLAAGATFKSLSARANTFTGNDRKATVTHFGDGGARVVVEGDQPLKKNVFWVLEVLACHLSQPGAQPVDVPPYLTIRTPGDAPNLVLKELSAGSEGSLTGQTLVGKWGQRLEAQVAVDRRPGGPIHPISLVIRVMECSGRQAAVSGGQDGYPILEDQPTDRHGRPLDAQIMIP
jgi:hypothetical protein